MKFKDIELLDQNSQRVRLSSLLSEGPLMVVFYPGDFTMVCTKQLCGYRDGYEEFKKLGIRIVGISPDSPQKHLEFIMAMGFPFPLLSDPKKEAFEVYEMMSFFGRPGRGNLLISKDRQVLYRYQELIPLTHRKQAELIETFSHILKTP